MMTEILTKIKVFTLDEPLRPCAHWSNGKHIVTEDGTCKCGKKFITCEVIEE